MKTKTLLSRISISSGLAIALAFAIWLPSGIRAQEHPAGHADDKEMPMKDAMPMQMNQIKTQAEAEAMKPGDAMSMACGKCKSVMIQKVGADQAHVKMMTIGEKTMCATCGGAVEIVGTGKGEGKNEEVKHVCSKCGDDAMFCAATKPGSGAMKDMKDMKNMKKDQN